MYPGPGQRRNRKPAHPLQTKPDIQGSDSTSLALSASRKLGELLVFWPPAHGWSVRTTPSQVVHPACCPTPRLTSSSFCAMGCLGAGETPGTPCCPWEETQGTEGFITQDALSVILTDSLKTRRGPVDSTVLCKGYVYCGGRVLECGDDQKLPKYTGVL